MRSIKETTTTTKNYISLCLVLAAVTAASILFIPGFSDLIETTMLLFLSTNARA